MKAAIFKRYGKVDVLEIADMLKPTIKPDELLVKIHAASVNPKDTFIRKGRFKRFTGHQFPMLTGFDFSGEIAEIGANIRGLSIGDAVYGMFDGWVGQTCAEYIAAKPSQLAKKPESLSFEEAAALPLVTLTAVQALRDNATIQKNQRVCISGASGGVGSMAVQIAKIYGAELTAIASKSNHDFLYELGADYCIDYHETDITQSDKRFDVFFDVFGNTRFRFIKPILSDRGIWVSTVIQPHVFRSQLISRFWGRKKAKLVIVKSNTADLELVREWVNEGKLKPVIHAIYPLENIREAHAQQETKHTQGKIVVKVTSN